jgi:thymidylate synthase (FAD)
VVNNQGRGEVLSPEQTAQVLEVLKADSARCYDNYQNMIDEDGIGLARELARMNLPANIYTQWYWKVDLHNLLHFLRLRADAHAQYEIRVYADAICQVVADWVPAAYKAFEDYRMGAVTMSAQMMVALRLMLKGEEVTAESTGMSAREWREFQDMIS